MGQAVAVRSLVTDDLDWVVDLAARRADRRQSFAPTFWRRAPDARRIHARYLGALIADPAVPAMRTEHTFAFGLRRPEFLLVDDAVVDRPAEAEALLRRLAAGSRVRFVCPVPDPERTELAVRLGFRCARTWWHRDLAGRTATGAPQHPHPRGRLVTAPPVYAPGGPVLLVDRFPGRPALAGMEDEAAGRGAVVSVVSQAPGDGVSEESLLACGYRRTCDFYEGTL